MYIVMQTKFNKATNTTKSRSVVLRLYCGSGLLPGICICIGLIIIYNYHYVKVCGYIEAIMFDRWWWHYSKDRITFDVF